MLKLTRCPVSRFLKLRSAAQLSSAPSNTPSNAPSGDCLYNSEEATTSLQEQLPRLPIPALEDTCARYLSAQRPLLNQQQHALTTDIINNFRNGVGKDLHAQLIETDKTLDRRFSYIHEAWTDMYQCDRGSVLLNQNPVLTYADDPDPARNTQLERATSLLVSTLRYFCTLRDNKLPPLKACMMQYPYLFQSTRLPGQGRDENVRYPDSRNVVVLRKGHLYSIDVLDDAGAILDSGAVKEALRKIKADTRPTNERGLGYFTALERNEWAGVRAELEEQNKDVLGVVDRAIFVICLDDVTTTSTDQVLQNGLVGDGYNRWMDKSFSLIVTEDGKAGVNWEHSWGDGATIINMMSETYQDAVKHIPVARPDSQAVSVERLTPQLSVQSNAALDRAIAQFNAAKSGYDLVDFSFGGFGKGDLKKFGVSPDSVSQLIFQMAQWRAHGTSVGTYESCSTAAFRSGRTETIRPCSAEMRNCSMAFDQDDPATLDEIVGLLKQVSVKHAGLCREAGQGQGFDRHLFALRNLNRLNGEEELEVFTDSSYSLISSIKLSTSTVASPCLQLYLAFGAVHQQGYGLGYLMEQDKFGAAVSCYTPNEHFSDFTKHLGTACEDIHAVINGKSFKQGRVV